MSKAIWSPEAQADLDALDSELSQLTPDFALRVGRAALGATRFLAENPGAGPVFEGSVRKWRVRGTEYIILYRPASHGVDIVRMHHARRDWRPRRP